MTVSEALRDATLRMAAAGVPSPGHDAELLLRHALGWDRAALLARGREPLAAEAAGRLAALLSARARRVPLQHLTGRVEFWRREFRVSPAALIPRPETELLVESALELLRGRAAPLVVDVGTGSGCIALTLAAERPDALVHAVDLSGDALALARENADRLGLAGRVSFEHGDLLAAVLALRGRVDLVASNPPYVSEAEFARLEPEVRDHEPRMALVPPGGDAYAMYRRLAPQAAALLAPGGWLVVEIGAGMEPGVAAALTGAGLLVRRVISDLRAIPRVLAAAAP